MDLLVLDFETYYDADYTLKKLTTEAYIRDPRFEALCLGVLDPQDPPAHWRGQEEIERYFRTVDWSDTAVLCHHAQFDGLILSHHFGVRPKYWFDTLSMARLVIGNHVPVGLESLCKHFGLPPKNVPYDLFRGRHWHDLDAMTQQWVGEGAQGDCERTHELFKLMAPLVPRQELDLIDLTIRMFTEPSLAADVPALRALAAEEAERKARVRADLGIHKTELASAQQFAAILTGIGVEVEYKDSPSGNRIPAVAKTDKFMQSLLEDDNEIVSALAAARLDARSTLDETRSGRLAGVAQRGMVPVYLSYCAAHTHRWGGGDKLNFQNFRRRRKDGSGGGLRESLHAPDGYLILTADESQVECRFLEAVAGETQALEDFRNGTDPYCGIASQFYGREITKVDFAERGMGKQIRLSCGYGAGAASIVATAKRGAYGPPVTLTEAQGVMARDLYRRSRPGVVRLWREGDEVLTFMAGLGREFLSVGEWRTPGGLALQIGTDGGAGWIEGPGGTRMLYTLKWDAMDRGGWRRQTRSGWPHIWGGVVVQNLMEFLCRNFTGEKMIQIRREMPFMQLAWMSHDELNYIVPDSSEAPGWLARVIEILSTPPAWLPNVPLAAEGSVGRRYEK